MWRRIRRFFSSRAFERKGPPLARILIVDDDNTACGVIQSVLVRKGYEVHIAHDGISGFEAAQSYKPDMIFLDCLMPGLSGVEVGRMLKNNPSTKDIPIIVLTALDSPRNIIDCYDFGAENYLVKPVSPRELLKLVETNLQDFVAAPES